MLAVLAADWGLLLTRAALALVLGVLLFAWPEPTQAGFLLLFGLYTLVDGLAVAIVAFGMRGTERLGSLFLEAVVRAGGGILALAVPSLFSSALPISLGVWAGLSGLAQIAAAVALRRELTGHWPLPVAATLSLVMATFCIMREQADLQSLVWGLAVYLLLSFAVLMVFARRMWQLACEMGKA